MWNNILITALVATLLLLGGCSRSYYFSKEIDHFGPRTHETFYINPVYGFGKTINTPHQLLIQKKLKEKLQAMPLKYTLAGAAKYILTFSYNKRWLKRYKFGLLIKQTSPNPKAPNTIIYQAAVFSYDANFMKALGNALKIFTDDLRDATYPQSQHIPEQGLELVKVKKGSTKSARQRLEHLSYRLYDVKPPTYDEIK